MTHIHRQADPDVVDATPGIDVDISVILCTYNRAGVVARALESLLTQDSASVRYDVTVVDNNSTDETPSVIHAYRRRAPTALRSIFEPRQGVAYARNAGVVASRGRIIAFTDDDVRVTPNWIKSIKHAFDEHPETDVIGGKVLPEWTSERPRWLTNEHWSPLALQDFGDSVLNVDADQPRCLVAANLAVRRELFDRIGFFEPTLQRVRDRIGSIEDDEFLRRALAAGGRALYIPDLVATTEVPAERLKKSYHRRWHLGHGHFYALLRAPEIEASRLRFLGVPGHLYRQGLRDMTTWLSLSCSGDHDRAFDAEVRLCFLLSFLSTRLRTSATGRGQSENTLLLRASRPWPPSAAYGSETPPKTPSKHSARNGSASA